MGREKKGEENIKKNKDRGKLRITKEGGWKESRLEKI